jgi:hypothetical protein
MLKGKLSVLTVTIFLIATILGLGGCRREETTTDQQALPLVGGGNSPLPTPGLTDSPITP